MGNEIFIDVESGSKSSFDVIYKAYESLLSKFYCREEGQALLDKTVNQSGKSSFIHIKNELIEKLNMAGVEASDSMTIDELKECVRKLPNGMQMDQKMFDVLYNMYQTFENPAKQMEKIVRRLGIPEYQNGSVRLAILKQFILNTDYHTGPVKEMIRSRIHSSTGELIHRRNVKSEILAEWADESLFKQLDFKLTKDEKKKYALLRLCDDLASGRFRTNGSTRLALYMFAFAFDMTFYSDAMVGDYDQDRDIEKNLFFDFYRNHMLRILSESDSLSDYEANPSGEGINYKNFAEIIYLYYLNRKELPIRDRISKAEKMIAKCQIEAGKMGRVTRQPKLSQTEQFAEYYTYVYKDCFIDAMSSITEEQLPQFIVEHYSCTEKNCFRTKMMISSDTRTAVFHYRNFVKKSYTHYERRMEIERILAENPDWNSGFVLLIRRLNEMLHPVIKPDTERLSREELIAGFYDFCRNSSDQEGMSLRELYDDCCQKLNPILIDSRFQPLRVTNIFDIYMIIMLYRYLNIV